MVQVVFSIEKLFPLPFCMLELCQHQCGQPLSTLGWLLEHMGKGGTAPPPNTSVALVTSDSRTLNNILPTCYSLQAILRESCALLWGPLMRDSSVLTTFATIAKKELNKLWLGPRNNLKALQTAPVLKVEKVWVRSVCEGFPSRQITYCKCCRLSH